MSCYISNFLKLGVCGAFCPWAPSARWARINSGAFGLNARRPYRHGMDGGKRSLEQREYFSLLNESFGVTSRRALDPWWVKIAAEYLSSQTFYFISEMDW